MPSSLHHLLAICSWGLVGAGCAAWPFHGEPQVSFRELVPGVWLHTSTKLIPPWGRIPTTGLVVEHGEGSILVDTAWDDGQTEVVVRWARDTLGKPLRAAVFTHAHADKMGGVGALEAAGVVTWAAPDSNALAPGRGLVPARRALHFDAEGVSREIPPLVVFDPGGGHTSDNIVVGLPTRGVLFGGCMIRPPGAQDLGNTRDADLAHWDAAVVATGRRFPEARHVVPSHGPPGDRGLLGATIRLVRAARTR